METIRLRFYSSADNVTPLPSKLSRESLAPFIMHTASLLSFLGGRLWTIA